MLDPTPYNSGRHTASRLIGAVALGSGQRLEHSADVAGLQMVAPGADLGAHRSWSLSQALARLWVLWNLGPSVLHQRQLVITHRCRKSPQVASVSTPGSPHPSASPSATGNPASR